MSYPVRYYCPRCETIVELERSGYLEDKSVTPYPLEGWSYADVDGDYGEADGVRIVCGDDGSTDSARFVADGADAAGCGEPFYLNFVRFEDGREIEPTPETERVELAPEGPRPPSGPDDPW